MDFFCHPLFLYLRRPLVDFAFLWERRTIPFRDTTLRGYSGTFRTLNGERLPFSHLKVSNGR